MRLGPALLILFLLVPLLEIYLLLEVGGVIGVGWTIFAVVFTAVVGAALVRWQGFSTINRIRRQLQQKHLPAVELFEGAFLLAAGALLLTPGFFTDALGFACLTPPIRRAVIHYLMRRGTVSYPADGAHGPARPGSKPGAPLEGQYRRTDD